MNSPEFYTFTFEVRTTEYKIYYMKIVATTHENAFTKLFRYLRRKELENSPLTKIINVESYIFE